MAPIQEFLAVNVYAVAGASTDREKYGNRVFRKLIQTGRTVYPLNPHAAAVEGQQAFKSIADLPEKPQALSIITPPETTRRVVDDALAAGVKHIWMQPGAEDAEASKKAREAGVNVIDDGSCILVALAGQSR